MQHQPGEFQRETLSPKTVRVTGGLWTALTKRDFVLFGEVECAKNLPRCSWESRGGLGHIETRSKEELRQDWVRTLRGHVYTHSNSATKETRQKVQFVLTDLSCARRTESVTLKELWLGLD